MPLAVYKCDAGHGTERLFKYSERPVEIVCPRCGGRACLNVAATFRPAKTAGKWGESAGRFDRGLGCYVRDSRHRDQVMAAKGLVAETDMPNGYADSLVQAQINEKVQHDRDMSRLQANLKEYKDDPGAAWAETFPVDLDTLDLSGD